MIQPGPALKPGATHPRVGVLRKRLEISGELAGGSAGDQYDDALAGAVKRFQEGHRLTADGSIGRATLAALNVTAAARVDQIRVNLERSRWVVGGLSDTFVLVNLPAFKVYLIRAGKNVWETRAQVGRAGRQTPSFRADMRYIVFNPDWTVPPTILAQDVLGAMRKGEDAISKKRLTILDRRGRPVAPASIDWSAATPATFPYTLRQPPGPDNALGRVKFIFPNEHAIFLHDTPSQELFRADERTFSSGCIRVEQPLDFAAVLLDGQQDWDRARVQRTVDAGKTETVFLTQPLPVLIVYWTVSVGASGELRYARDVYGLDAAVLRALNARSRS
jgi:murein L,D-transpeptidase YcbB/YkuD